MKIRYVFLLFLFILSNSIVIYPSNSAQTSLEGEHIKIVFSEIVTTEVLDRVTDLLPYLDQTYTLLQNWTAYTPFNGEKIIIKYDRSFFVDKDDFIIGWSGNPTHIKVYPSGDLEQDLYIYFHELTHDFTPLNLWNIFESTPSVREGIADLGAVYLYHQFGYKEWIQTSRNNTLTSYEREGTLFNLVHWEDDHPKGDKYPSDHLAGGFFLSLNRKYGFNFLRDFFQASKTAKGDYIFGDDSLNFNKTMNYLVYLLSNSTACNLTPLFTFWGFPLTCDSDHDGITDGEEIGKGLDIPDFDEDGIYDDVELSLKTNPNNIDTDNDGINDYQEIQYETDPTQIDTDADFWSDKTEIEWVQSLPILYGIQNNWFIPNIIIILIALGVFIIIFKRIMPS